jgi:hypothetical protein
MRKSMKGKRFTVYGDDTDVISVFDAVADMGGVVVGLKSNTPELRVIDKHQLTGEPMLLLLPSELREEVRPRSSTGGGLYALNAVADPVIEFIPSRQLDGELTPGRFYFVENDVVDNAFVAKSPYVQRLAEDVFGWARRWARRAGGKACGPSAASAIREGRLRLKG